MPLTEKTPKPLLKINEISLLENTINLIKALEIRERVESILGDKFQGSSINNDMGNKTILPHIKISTSFSFNNNVLTGNKN